MRARGASGIDPALFKCMSERRAFGDKSQERGAAYSIRAEATAAIDAD